MGKTINIKVSEHRHLRNLCRKRFKFGIKILYILLACFFVSLLLSKSFWQFTLGLLILFAVTTALEYRDYKKHSAALKKLGIQDNK
ncbi:hypothetical protein [Psychromonas aquimarina]|uniref:hypothetical protein n=1 Tax=Psychromonas aquimarina TaxID=444919 RepID=UPI00041F9D2B|nr:hypothetical protein [Psychromonas aquimarina]